MGGLQGVVGVTVDLEQEKATIHGAVDVTVLIAAVEGAGFGAVLPTPPDPEYVVLSVGGMMCEHCTASVERNLLAVTGVKSVEVDLERERATVRGTARVDAMIAAVEAGGNSACVLQPSDAVKSSPSSVVHLRVEPLTCNGCRSIVTAALKALPGVHSVTVDLDSKLATVKGTAAVEALVDALKAVHKLAVLLSEDELNANETGPSSMSSQVGCWALGKPGCASWVLHVLCVSWPVPFFAVTAACQSAPSLPVSR